MGQPMIFDSSQFNTQLMMGVTGASSSSSVPTSAPVFVARPPITSADVLPQPARSKALEDSNYSHPRACHKRQHPDGSGELTESDEGVDTTSIRRGRGRPVGRRNSPTTVDDKV